MKEILLLVFLVSGFIGLNVLLTAVRGGQLRRQEEQRANPHNR